MNAEYCNTQYQYQIIIFIKITYQCIYTLVCQIKYKTLFSLTLCCPILLFLPYYYLPNIIWLILII